jgi:hypothetical protein
MTAIARRSEGSAPKYIKLDGVVLTGPMAAVLLSHANGPRPIRSSDKDTHTLKALKARRLIYFNRLNRPTHTIATSRGRELVAALLAAQADTLTAQLSEQDADAMRT